MIRKVTAICLLFLMMVAAATSQAGLRYCLCLEEIYVADCNCCFELANTNSCVSEACSSCSQEQEKSTLVDSVCQCDTGDCSIALSLDLDDYFNPSVNYSSSDKGDNYSSPQSSGLVVKPYSKSVRAENGKRGPPVEQPFPEPEPVRIRHSVFLI